MNVSKAKKTNPTLPTHTDSDNPLGLQSDEAKGAYQALLKASEGRGKVLAKSGRPLSDPHPAPEKCSLPQPEANYDKPDGFLLISRSFPCVTNKKDDMHRVATAELTAAKLPSDQKTVEECVKLQSEMKKRIFAALTSKLRLRIDEEVVDQRVSAGGRDCKEGAEAIKAFRESEPTLELCEKIYNVFYRTFEDPAVLTGIVYDVMMDLKLWYSSDTNSLNMTAQKEQAKAPCLLTIARNKVREIRHKLTEKDSSLHGVTLKISQVGGRKSKRRKKHHGFVASECVSGWAEARHVQFCKENDFQLPRPIIEEQNRIPQVASASPSPQSKPSSAGQKQSVNDIASVTQSPITQSSITPVTQSPASSSASANGSFAGHPTSGRTVAVPLDRKVSSLYCCAPLLCCVR